MKRKRIDALTGGRFFAMMLIVTSHLEFMSSTEMGKIYSRFLHNPTLGVDYFFILSGFGMMYSHLQKSKDGPEAPLNLRTMLPFAVRHVKKIYPVYLVCIGLGVIHYLLFYWFFSGDNSVNALVLILVKAVVKIVPALLVVQSATGMSVFSNAFCGTSWFLSSLFCIQIFAPALMQLLKKHLGTTKRYIATLILLAAGASAATSLFAMIERCTPFDVLVYASPYTRVFYVMFGMVLAQLFLATSHKKVGKMEYVAIPLAGLYYLLKNELFLPSGVHYAVDIFVCGFAVYAIASGTGVISRFLASRKLVYLGNLSMYVFLIHYLLRMYAVSIADVLCWNGPVVAAVQCVIIVLGGYVVSAILYKYKNSGYPWKG